MPPETEQQIDTQSLKHVVNVANAVMAARAGDRSKIVAGLLLFAVTIAEDDPKARQRLCEVMRPICSNSIPIYRGCVTRRRRNEFRSPRGWSRRPTISQASMPDDSRRFLVCYRVYSLTWQPQLPPQGPLLERSGREPQG
jgi:hypothetical protein